MKNLNDLPTEVMAEMTEKELDVVTTVFRSYETGLREATILPKVSLSFIVKSPVNIFIYWKNCAAFSDSISHLIKPEQCSAHLTILSCKSTRQHCLGKASFKKKI